MHRGCQPKGTHPPHCWDLLCVCEGCYFFDQPVINLSQKVFFSFFFEASSLLLTFLFCPLIHVEQD